MTNEEQLKHSLDVIEQILGDDADAICKLQSDVRELKDMLTNLFAVSAILLAGVSLSLIIGT